MKTMLLTCGLLLPLAAWAATDDLQAELGKCARIADIKTRVACYDRLAPPAEPAQRAETFGQPKPKARPEPRDEPDDALVATVASITEVQPGKLQITLANGQVWRQTVAKAFLLRPGDTVRIAGSGWGRSFRLAIEGHPGYIQVSRVQ